MAYSSEFEKVHYPLPLNYEDNNDSAKLKSTILRMKDELDVAKNRKLSTDDFQSILIDYSQQIHEILSTNRLTNLAMTT